MFCASGHVLAIVGDGFGYVMCWVCFVYVSDMLRICVGQTLEMSWACFYDVYCMFRVCFVYDLAMYRQCFGHAVILLLEDVP